MRKTLLAFICAALVVGCQKKEQKEPDKQMAGMLDMKSMQAIGKPVKFELPEGKHLSFLFSQNGTGVASPKTVITLVRAYKDVIDTTRLLLSDYSTRLYTLNDPGMYQMMMMSSGEAPDSNPPPPPPPPPDGGTPPPPDGDKTPPPPPDGGTPPPPKPPEGGTPPPTGGISHPIGDSLSLASGGPQPLIVVTNPCTGGPDDPCNQSSIISHPIGDSLQTIMFRKLFRQIEVIKTKYK